MRLTALLIAFALASAPAAAEIYRWTDEKGQPHFTQSLDQVPPQYRKAARDGAMVERETQPAALQPAAHGATLALVSRRSNGTLEIPFERHGNLMKVDARVNDRISVPFLIDTGASGVTLPQHLVSRLGVRIGPETPQVYVSTANGVVKVPLVRLSSVQLGGARVENLEATVNPTLEIGLLGGAFFNNFVYGVDAARSVITLTVNDRIRGGFDQGAWRKRFRSARNPLTRLEQHLEEGVARDGERARLEQHRELLRLRLEQLEDEANRARVPASWRE